MPVYNMCEGLKFFIHCVRCVEQKIAKKKEKLQSTQWTAIPRFEKLKKGFDEQKGGSYVRISKSKRCTMYVSSWS